MGLNAFLERQLHPERIEDGAIEERVAALPTLSMSSEELYENFPPSKQARVQGQPNPREEAMQAGQAMPAAMPQGPQRVIMELAQEEVLRATGSNRQLQEVMVQFWMNHFNIFAPKGADKWLVTSYERDTIRPNAMGKFEDLLVATAKSPAMLFYLDNWLSAMPTPNYGLSDEKRAPIWRRDRAQENWPYHARFGGSFGPGPGASDTVRLPQRDPQTEARLGNSPQRPNSNKQMRRGLNENYAREVMELHTMGVDGGYTQKDVIEVARCLTGWSIDRPQKGGGFIFRPRMHDWSAKEVLGHKISSGRGVEDGMEVLHLLAHHPATAHFISLKLCRRFVADDPPPALVDRATQKFLKSDGDIRAVLKTILTSKEFYSQAAYRAKVKSPLELVVSSVRALGAETDASVPLLRMIATMGQPMFQYQAPAGFPDRAGTWINSGSLLMRINFATALVANRIPGTQIDFKQLDLGAPGTRPEELVEDLSKRLVGDPLRAETRKAILENLSDEGLAEQRSPDPSPGIATGAGSILASPDFQRR
jgi:uncharacterized protein (DUF1800 family)